jgi:hypothetical protein
MGTLKTVHAIAAVCSLAACATTPDTQRTAFGVGDDCMFASALSDWRPLDDEHLILFATGRVPYLVELFRAVPSLSYDIAIGVYDRDGRICAYGGDAIIVDGPLVERIPIRAIRRLTDEELEEAYVQYGIRRPRVMDVEPVDVEAADPSD